jgi:glucoamylase
MLRTPRPGAELLGAPVAARNRRRWALRRSAVLGVGLLAVAGTLSAYAQRDTAVRTSLYGAAVAVDANGNHVVLPNSAPPSALLPGSRVIVPTAPQDLAAAQAEAAAQQAWLANGDIPGAGTRWESMTRDALLDLKALTPPSGGTAAAWITAWRYVWPRDASFVAVAFARTGHLPDAERELSYLQQVQEANGTFQARYVLDGSGPPDGRWPQSDGPGWALWATNAVVTASPAAARIEVAEQDRALIERSTAILLQLTDDGRVLPPASPDYRELPEDAVTIGIAGPFLAGLDVAGPLARLLGETATAQRAEAAAARFAQVVARTFGPAYHRTAGSNEADAAVTFVLPPFTTNTPLGAITAAQRTAQRLVRPAGGLAPGSDWPNSVISWTPETALFALTSAATGDRAGAGHWLDWLDTHRTGLGALPEKVDADGHPAGPAPLAWTDALVLLTVTTLDPS